MKRKKKRSSWHRVSVRERLHETLQWMLREYGQIRLKSRIDAHDKAALEYAVYKWSNTLTAVLRETRPVKR